MATTQQQPSDKPKAAGQMAGLKGRHESKVSEPTGGDLLKAAQEKAPNLTAEFVDAFGLTDEDLAGIARGSIPPPPAIGPVHTADLYLTPAGWQQTHPGVKPEDANSDAIAR